MPAPEISVVIPAYNEATYIGRLLGALTRQSYHDFEVIVSDARSGDNTAQVVNDLKGKLDIKLVTSPPRGPGAGRNAGAKIARGQWLLFLDADNDIDDPDFIKILLTKTAAHSWKVSSTKMKLRSTNPGHRLTHWLNYKYIKLLAHTKHPVAPGWCIFTRRDVFEAHKGFNEKIQFGEDYDYVSRAGRGVFGFIEDTAYQVDPRRNEEENWRLTLKAIANEIYRHTHGYNLEKNPIKYEFGKHRERHK